MPKMIKYYHRNPDAQQNYDKFFEDTVTANKRWEEFVDHDIQRLTNIIDAGGSPADGAARLCKCLRPRPDLHPRGIAILYKWWAAANTFV
jgi:hypothetical protein